jgi:hypothetical protein
MTADEVAAVTEQVAELKVEDKTADAAPVESDGNENIVDGPSLELPKKFQKDEKKLAKVRRDSIQYFEK